MWHTILVEYHRGTTKILKSFSRPAKDSDGKFNKKVAPKKMQTEKSNSEVDLFD